MNYWQATIFKPSGTLVPVIWRRTSCSAVPTASVYYFPDNTFGRSHARCRGIILFLWARWAYRWCNWTAKRVFDDQRRQLIGCFMEMASLMSFAILSEKGNRYVFGCLNCERVSAVIDGLEDVWEIRSLTVGTLKTFPFVITRCFGSLLRYWGWSFGYWDFTRNLLRNT